jgi:hypothetical protein
MKIAIGSLGFLIAAAFNSPLLAGCDISTYDQSPPSAIKSSVNKGNVQFEWATDVDTTGGYNWIWHYVKNTHDRGLGYKWPKADLRHALGSPLEPGQVDCNRYFVMVPAVPDDDAPIMYGTNDSVQRAAVFAPTKSDVGAASPSTGSIIETSYRNAAGAIENVRVAIGTSKGSTPDGLWNFVVERTPNAIVAISTIPKFFTSDQIKSLFIGIMAQTPQGRLSEGARGLGRFSLPWSGSCSFHRRSKSSDCYTGHRNSKSPFDSVA